LGRQTITVGSGRGGKRLKERVARERQRFPALEEVTPEP
jgi:hypothetical protein